MKTVAIIAEYNPLHNGHLDQLREARRLVGRQGAIIVALSGDFVQRGGPAIADKWRRAAWAIDGGADLVIELPLLGATGTAETFAEHAIALLKNTGVVRHLLFGSPDSDLAAYDAVAQILDDEPPAYQAALRLALERHEGYARARMHAVHACLGADCSRLLAGGDSVLGVHYRLSLRRAGWGLPTSITPRSTQPSASALRGALITETTSPHALLALRQQMPPSVLGSLLYLRAQEQLGTFAALFRAVLPRLIDADAETLCAYETMRPDLGARLLSQVKRGVRPGDGDLIVAATATYPYPASRVRRALTDLYLNLQTRPVRPDAPVIRVLAATRIGRYVLTLMKTTATVPVVTRTSDVTTLPEPAAGALRAMTTAADRYALLIGRGTHADFDRHPLIR